MSMSRQERLAEGLALGEAQVARARASGASSEGLTAVALATVVFANGLRAALAHIGRLSHAEQTACAVLFLQNAQELVGSVDSQFSESLSRTGS